MEYVIVTFPTRRRLYIDDEPTGYTNQVLGVDAGTHVFNLGKRPDYQPRSRKVAVKDTTSGKPKKIAFRKKRKG